MSDLEKRMYELEARIKVLEEWTLPTGVKCCHCGKYLKVDFTKTTDTGSLMIACEDCARRL